MQKPISRELRKEMLLTLEPVRMVNMKLQEIARTANYTDDHGVMMQHPAAGVADHLSLQILQLSNLDHLYNHYNSIALFYNVADKMASVDDGIGIVHIGPVKRLQGALEELLLYHPAAAGRLCHSETEPGRLQVEYYCSALSCHTSGDNLLHGVPFVVAHANIALRELGDVSDLHPSLDLLYPTLPDSGAKYLPPPVMAVQVTTFTCGGFCLAHMCSHTFMDGHAVATFLQNMCSIARGAGLTVPPAATVLICRREMMKPRIPPTPSPTVSYTYMRTHQRGEEKVQAPVACNSDVTVRFAFSTTALEALRLKGSTSKSQQAPKPTCSRYQALVALLWTARAKSLMASHSPRPPDSQALNLCFPINLREKGIQGLTRGYIGNAIFQLTVSATLQELCESPLPSVVCKIKSVVAASMANLPECAQSQIDYIELQLRAGLVPCMDRACLAMPSIVNLPFYDTDCGWGHPVYCARPSRQLAGHRLVILDHPAVEAWNVLAVFSSQEEHASFHQEIAEYIS